jgi:hypothetical protein
MNEARGGMAQPMRERAAQRIMEALGPGEEEGQPSAAETDKGLEP